MKYILHIDFNSFFATVEQQANPRLRGKPIAVSGGDRLTRTVIGAASVEAKARGVRSPMKVPEALKLCPDLILVRGDSDKYLSVTKKFLNVLKGYSDKIEVFSIDEVFLEINPHSLTRKPNVSHSEQLLAIALDIKDRIRKEAGDWITCSIGISYNKMLAKLAGSLYKPDGLVGIMDSESAVMVLDTIELDEVCGIGRQTRRHLNNMGIFNFADLRQAPLPLLLAGFKSYGKVLYDFARGIDNRPVVPFFEKEEVKSIGHRHTTSRDTDDEEEIKQILLKLCELVARRARAKKLEGRTISFWYRKAFDRSYFEATGSQFFGEGMQVTIFPTSDGLDIFNAAWKIFMSLWDKGPIRMVGVSISNLQPTVPQTVCFLDEVKRREVITKALDKINDRYGEFTLQRGILLNSKNIKRMANSFIADRRFKI